MPYGFPVDETKWTFYKVDTTDRIQTNVTLSTYYNPGSVSISVPIGVWKLSIGALIGMFSQDASGQGQFECALSTSNNSISNTKLTAGFLGYIFTATARVKGTIYCEDTINLTSKTVYYAIIASLQNVGTTDIGYYNATTATDVFKPCVIKAVCAYL